MVGEMSFPRGVACGVPKLLDPPPPPLCPAGTSAENLGTFIHLDFFDRLQPVGFSASLSRLRRAWPRPNPSVTFLVVPQVVGWWQETMGRRNSCTIYVGNLPGDIREREVEDLFYKYGRIVDIDLKIPPRPPGYAFVEFEDPRDADDAIYGRDGYDFDGYRLRVELAHGGKAQSYSYDRPSSFSSGRRGGVSRRSEYRVMVDGLPSSASWQDLKDHMRRAGDVCFSDVYREAGATVGIVDYTNYDDMKYAIRKLDGTEFRNAFSRAYIRVREYDARSRSRSRSLSYSRSRSYSRSVSRSPLPVDERSLSRSRSPVSSVSGKSVSRSPRSRSVSRSASPARSD
ncbi:hypothetical protein ZWY2020_004448 [Hordeum vulgare]|nr:hypothetical protein ZWY2020_004448 [Hordeum vulgare]